MRRQSINVCWLCLCLLVLPLAAQAQDFSGVPGVVINYEESPSGTDPKVYLSTPSITMMPNGDYFVSNDYFGSGTNENTIKVFRSTDKGQTWTYQSTVGGFWSTIFQLNGDLYIWGYREGGTNGDIIIRKSTDNGLTWTNPTNATNGLLKDGDYGGSANSPVIYNGRIWIAQGGTRIMSAPVNSNLLLASSWTLSNAASVQSGPLGSGLTITEAQVVASPQAGVLIMPKVGNLPYSVLLHASSPSTLVNPTNEDWVSIPGCEKKFGVQYDPVSQKYYILNGPVLPVHEGVTTTALTRTTAAMLSSKDLINWDVEKIFLFTNNIDNGTFGEGFQYFNFAIDGDDLAVASRTAFVVPGENLPPRGHDSNLITFHTIENFRTATPDQYLLVDTGGDKVLRYEVTQNEDAPLGSFTLGATFSGAALNNPDGVGQDSNGDVYIHEQGGRILRFDALGNFIETVTSSPVSFSSQVAIQQAAPGERTWTKAGSGTWFDPTNWYYWGRPDTDDEVANFGSAITAAATISLDRTFTTRGMRFRSLNKYTIGGTGGIVIAASSGHGVLDVQLGIHEVQNNLLLDSDTDATLGFGSLTLSGQVDLNGHTLNVTGPGVMNVTGTLTMSGGALGFTLTGVTTPSLNITSHLSVDGSLVLSLAPGFTPQYGDTFNILGAAILTGQFDAIDGVIVNDDLALAVRYYVNSVTVTAALPGDANLDGVINLADLQILGDNWQNAAANWVDADFNGDRTVDLADLQILGDHWNATAGDFEALAAAFIPEPAAALLLVPALGVMMRRNRGSAN